MYKVLINCQDASASSYYRASMPWQQCAEETRKRGVRLDLSNGFPEGYDCYILQRRLDPKHLASVFRLKGQGKKLVWDLDDHLFEIPAWSPACNMMGDGGTETLLTCLEMSDIITVTTGRFARTLGEPTTWMDKIRVLPNLVNLDDWAFPASSRSGPVRILWAGSNTHQKDLESIGNDLIKIIDKYKSEIHVYFVGAMPPQFLPMDREKIRRFRGLVTLLGPVDLMYYADLIDLIRPDVALMPLVDCAFNRCKSPIKFMEMALGGGACVASPVGPYADAIEDGYSGLLSTDFYKSISILVEDSTMRARLSATAAEVVRSRHSWQAQRGRWVDFFAGLAD